jgi:hypothetical protein
VVDKTNDSSGDESPLGSKALVNKTAQSEVSNPYVDPFAPKKG